MLGALQPTSSVLHFIQSMNEWTTILNGLILMLDSTFHCSVSIFYRSDHCSVLEPTKIRLGEVRLLKREMMAAIVLETIRY